MVHEMCDGDYSKEDYIWENKCKDDYYRCLAFKIRQNSIERFLLDDKTKR